MEKTIFTIKQTKSLSPLSCKEIEARVILENNKVYLLKYDEQGKEYKYLIEKDYEFYQLLTKNPVTAQVPPCLIPIHLSSRCNLSCRLCYEDDAQGQEPSLEDLENLLKNFKYHAVALEGREPTCREDLFQIIEKLTQNKHPVILTTNGIKLANYNYVRDLKKSGVHDIFFSLNGFDDKIYQQMNGKPLLDLKLKALNNIKNAGIPTIISVTLARGINDDQIRKIYNYCMDNRSFIIELRIRTAAPVGKSLSIEPYCLSEMVGLVTRSLEFNRKDVLKENILLQECREELKFILPFYIQNFLRNRLCCFSFYTKRSGADISSLGSNIDLERIKQSKLKKWVLLYYLAKLYGMRYILERSAPLMGMPNFLKNKNILKISLRCWPNIYNIDLEENKKCGSLYYRNSQLHPFCYYNILTGHKKHKEKNC